MSDTTMMMAPRIGAARLQTRGARRTSLRQQVLEVLRDAGQPLSAYEIMARLEAMLRRKLSPPSVYRPLEFLVDHRLVVRIESRNAYAACAHPERLHEGAFFVCNRCSALAEVDAPDLRGGIARASATLGFRVVRRVMEFEGICARCLAATDTPFLEGR